MRGATLLIPVITATVSLTAKAEINLLTSDTVVCNNGAMVTQKGQIRQDHLQLLIADKGVVDYFRANSNGYGDTYNGVGLSIDSNKVTMDLFCFSATNCASMGQQSRFSAEVEGNGIRVHMAMSGHQAVNWLFEVCN